MTTILNIEVLLTKVFFISCLITLILMDAVGGHFGVIGFLAFFCLIPLFIKYEYKSYTTKKQLILLIATIITSVVFVFLLMKPYIK